MTEEETKKFQEKEKELTELPEKRALDATADAEAEVPAAKKTRSAAVA
jgi:homocitrate synthase